MTRPNPRMAPKISAAPVETEHPQECILTEHGIAVNAAMAVKLQMHQNCRRLFTPWHPNNNDECKIKVY